MHVLVWVADGYRIGSSAYLCPSCVELMLIDNDRQIEQRLSVTFEQPDVKRMTEAVIKRFIEEQWAKMARSLVYKFGRQKKFLFPFKHQAYTFKIMTKHTKVLGSDCRFSWISSLVSNNVMGINEVNHTPLENAMACYKASKTYWYGEFYNASRKLESIGYTKEAIGTKLNTRNVVVHKQTETGFMEKQLNSIANKLSYSIKIEGTEFRICSLMEEWVCSLVTRPARVYKINPETRERVLCMSEIYSPLDAILRLKCMDDARLKERLDNLNDIKLKE